MRLFLLIILTFFNYSIFAQASWTMFQGCEKHCGINPGAEYKSFGETRWKFKTQGKIFSSPAVLEGKVFFGSEDHYLYAVDTQTGNLTWKFKTNGAVHSSPAVYKNVVYFGSFDGYYYAVDALTGKEKWKFKTEGEKWMGGNGYFGMNPSNEYHEDPWEYFLSSPVLDPKAEETTIYFGSSDGYLYAVSAEDGKLRWKYKTQGIIHSTPALYKGKVYIGSWDTYLYAIDAQSGQEIWKFKTGDQPYMTGIQASPTADDDKIYFGARDANFYALNADTGELLWKYFADNSWVLTTAAVSNGVVYLGTSDSFLFLALDGKTGKEKFRVKTNGYVYSSPALLGNTAFFGDFTGQLFAIDLLSNGQKKDVFETVSRRENAGKVLNKQGNLDFVFLAQDKDISLYSTTESVMNQLYSLGSIVSSPTIKNGVVYFGSADGNLYAVNLLNSVSTDEHHHH